MRHKSLNISKRNVFLKCTFKTAYEISVVEYYLMLYLYHYHLQFCMEKIMFTDYDNGTIQEKDKMGP